MSDIFYRTVVLAVLLFGSETLVLSAVMARRLDGFHMGFLQKDVGETVPQKWMGCGRGRGQIVFSGKKGHRLWESISIVGRPLYQSGWCCVQYTRFVKKRRVTM